MEESDVIHASTNKKPAVKAWVHQTPDTYRKTAEKLVHFSAKTVNSNASAAGIRLAEKDALDLPYVSARTLMNAGVSLELDYAEGGAAQAGIIKQIMACQTNDPFADTANAEEKACIKPLLEKIRDERYELGTDRVDLRLRQILIPKEDAPGGYVSITPITSGSVCHYLFDGENGLVTLHNQKVSEEWKKKGGKDTTLIRIRQARMGIGGANPQNVGRLTRTMQQPVLVSAPKQDTSLRHAFSLYYKGLNINFNQFGPMRDALLAYREYLDNLVDRKKNTLITNMDARTGETELLHRICPILLSEGEKALSILRTYRMNLPQENPFPGQSRIEGEYEMVSRSVPGVIRGLIDPRLRKTDYLKDKTGRNMNWPREMAEHIATAILDTRYIKNGESIALFPLDGDAVLNLRAQLEDCFR